MISLPFILFGFRQDLLWIQDSHSSNRVDREEVARGRSKPFSHNTHAGAFAGEEVHQDYGRSPLVQANGVPRPRECNNQDAKWGWIKSRSKSA